MIYSQLLVNLAEKVFCLLKNFEIKVAEARQ